MVGTDHTYFTHLTPPHKICLPARSGNVVDFLYPIAWVRKSAKGPEQPGEYVRDLDTYEAVDIHPVRVRLSAGCTLYFKRIEVGGVGGVEREEIGYAMCIFFFFFFWC